MTVERAVSAMGPFGMSRIYEASATVEGNLLAWRCHERDLARPGDEVEIWYDSPTSFRVIRVYGQKLSAAQIEAAYDAVASADGRVPMMVR